MNKRRMTNISLKHDIFLNQALKMIPMYFKEQRQICMEALKNYYQSFSLKPNN